MYSENRLKKNTKQITEYNSPWVIFDSVFGLIVFFFFKFVAINRVINSFVEKSALCTFLHKSALWMHYKYILFVIVVSIKSESLLFLLVGCVRVWACLCVMRELDIWFIWVGDVFVVKTVNRFDSFKNFEGFEMTAKLISGWKTST